MSVLVEPGHKTQYPLNHARILYRNVITSVTADSAQLNSPASAVLAKTTYERWKPTTSGDSITGTFTEQVINSIAIAAHSNLTPTIEVRVNGSWEEIKAFPPAGESLILDFANDEYRELQYAPDNEALLLLIKPRLCDGVRVTAEFSDNAPSIGVLMAGTVLEMARPVYGGHSPAMLSSSSTVRPNVSESGEWLGASLIRQGRPVGINWRNLPAKWVRQNWHPFSEALKTSPYVFAWNPLRASADAIYCSSSDVPQPSNSGTRDLMTVSLSARGYSDGTEPVVQPTAEIDLLSAVTFTRASPAWGYNANGDLVEYADNVPRNVYDPVTLERIGLLIEEQRTNLLLWSEAFDNAVWSKSGATVTADAVVSPDGNNTADKLVENTADSQHLVAASFSGAASTTFTFSFFVKSAGRSVLFSIQDSAGGMQAAFNLDTEESILLIGTGTTPFVNRSSSIKPVGGGWYLVTCTGASSSTTGHAVSIQAADATKVQPFNVYLGDGTSGIYIWGAQIEAGSFPASYIKTEASQVTRSADNCSRPLGAEFNEDNYTAFADFTSLSGEANASSGVAILGSNSSNFSIIQGTGSTNSFAVDLRGVGGTRNIVAYTGFFGDGIRRRVAVTVSKDGKWQAYVDGEIAGSGDEGVTLDYSPVTDLELGASASLGTANVTIAETRLYPRALTAEELKTLTTP